MTIFLLGCSGSTYQPTDAGRPDLRPDVGRPDATDAAPSCFGSACLPDEYCSAAQKKCVRRGRALCEPAFCERDEDCGDERDLCLKDKADRPFCARACSDGSPCPDGFECRPADGVTGPYASQCHPLWGSCDVTGLACKPGTAGPCRAPDAECVTEGTSSYCSRRCESAGDCPTGFKYCASDDKGVRTCRRLVDTSSASCGKARNALGVGASCASGDCSAVLPGGTCVSADNALAARFCTRGCATDADCGAGAFCGSVASRSGAVCLPAACACLARLADADLEAALAAGFSAVKRDRCDLGHRFGELTRLYGDGLANDALRLTTYNQLYYAPMGIPLFVAALRRELASLKGSATPVSDALAVAGRLWDERHVVAAPLAPPASFEAAVTALYRVHTDAERRAALDRVTEDAKDLPVELKEQLAPIVAALAEAVKLRERAISYIGHSDALTQRFFRNTMALFYRKKSGSLSGAAVDLSKEPDASFLLRQLGYGLLLQAAATVARAVEGARLTPVGPERTFAFNQSTPFGRIVISDGHATSYKGDDEAYRGDLLLLVDAGGDDTYELPVGATRSSTNPVALALDLGGKDSYGYPKRPDPKDAKGRLVSDEDGRLQHAQIPVSLSEQGRQGYGNLGVGMLFDLGEGADTYESLRFSQGAGILGVGVLFDQGGDDTYRAEAGSQGSGHFGVGLLLDGGGNDRYEGYSAMQGAAYVKGVGLLADLGGNDRYVAQTGDLYVEEKKRLPGDDPIYGHGNNQGAAWGRRADYPIDGLENGVHSSGGAGVLFDLAGDDVYRCGSFCQGTGYWFGVGALLDEAGNDRYDGRIYTAGSAVHFGLGIFHDAAGDDAYGTELPLIGLSHGFAHDLSIGWHTDAGGKDTYRGAWQCFGTGSNQSLGVLVNGGGADDYQSTNYLGFGMATALLKNVESTSPRHALRTTGIFVDAAGADAYQRPAFFSPELVGDGVTWRHPLMETTYLPDGTPTGREITLSVPNAYGFGVDRAGSGR
ncbi:MAG: hypothetical protein IT371_06160 [Deltaproteobacteria bacterium]|nr:hypothetical protein [Deltaproteobacteria bacterium]